MRVLLTTDTIGGVWTFTRELTEQLLLRGHSVALVSFGRSPSSAQTAWCGSMASEHPRSFTYTASDAPLEWMQENHATFAEGAEVLTSVAATFRPDVVHSNQFCWGGLSFGAPVVITAHSDVMSWAATVKPETAQGSAWLSRYRALVQQGLYAADAVAVPTQWMRNALCAAFDVPSPFEMIYNGRTIQREEAFGQQQIRAVSVGRLWDPAKGLSTLLELNSAMPISIAGEDRFEGAAVPTAAGVTMLGPLSEDALLRLFRESCVYVAASIYEPFGLAPLEAALCGCAVVARDLESLREVWADSALYFRNAAELETLLRELTEDGAKLRRARRASATRARMFTAERMTGEYLALYERVAATYGSAYVHREGISVHAA